MCHTEGWPGRDEDPNAIVGESGDSALSMRQIHLGCHLPTLVSASAGIRLKGHFQVSKEKLF